MMRLVSHTITIERSISDVFDYMTNHENYANWYPGVVSVTSANTLPHGVAGKEYREVIKVPFSGEADFIITVIECELHDRFITEGNWSPLFPRMEVAFTRLSENETRVAWSLFSRNRNFLWSLLIRMLLKRMISRSSRAGLKRLKEVLER